MHYLHFTGDLVSGHVLALLPVMPLIAYLCINNRWAKDEPGFNSSLSAYKEALRSAVPNDALCIAGKDYSHYIFFYYINKKGWIFDNTDYPGADLKDAISKGARYLYCDDRHIDGNQSITPYLDKKMLVKGNIIVYRLKSAGVPL